MTGFNDNIIRDFRANAGWVGEPFNSDRLVLLHHVGAKSGEARISPLMSFPDDDGWVIVASKGGAPLNPAWFHNLRANPDTTIQVGTKRRPVRARVANAAERKRLWPKAVKTYGGYAGYQQRTEREIPLVILKPRAG